MAGLSESRLMGNPEALQRSGCFQGRASWLNFSNFIFCLSVLCRKMRRWCLRTLSRGDLASRAAWWQVQGVGLLRPFTRGAHLITWNSWEAELGPWDETEGQKRGPGCCSRPQLAWEYACAGGECWRKKPSGSWVSRRTRIDPNPSPKLLLGHPHPFHSGLRAMTAYSHSPVTPYLLLMTHFNFGKCCPFYT